MEYKASVWNLKNILSGSWLKGGAQSTAEGVGEPPKHNCRNPRTSASFRQEKFTSTALSSQKLPLHFTYIVSFLRLSRPISGTYDY